MRNTARPPVGIGSDNIRTFACLGSGGIFSDACLSRSNAPGAVPYDAKLTSSSAVHTPVSATRPLLNLCVYVPAPFTFLFSTSKLPAPLNSYLSPCGALAAAGQAGESVESQRKPAPTRKV